MLNLRVAAAVLVGRQFPEDFDMRQRPRHQYDVARAVTENSVSDVNIANPRVLSFSFHGFPLFAGYAAASKELSSPD